MKACLINSVRGKPIFHSSLTSHLHMIIQLSCEKKKHLTQIQTTDGTMTDRKDKAQTRDSHKVK